MLHLISTITPPSFSRAWSTSAHPDLPIIATCFSDKSVRIYSLTSFTLLSTISGGHKRSVRSCAWKPNLRTESVIATGSFDATVGIWRSSRIAPAGPSSPDDHDGGGDAGDDDDDEEEWRFAILLEGHDSEVKSISWSAGGNLLATSSRDKSVWIWEEVAEDDFETVAVMQEHEQDVKCVAWHPYEELVASGSYDTEIRLWKEDGDDWGCVEVLRGHTSTVWAIDWEPNPIPPTEDNENLHAPPRLVSCSDDMTIRIWKNQKNDGGGYGGGSGSSRWIEQATLPHTHELAIYSVAWGEGGRILSTGADGRLVVYEERPVLAPTIPMTIDGAGTEEAHHNTSKAASSSENNTTTAPNSTYPTSPPPPPNPSSFSPSPSSPPPKTEWIIQSEFENAHSVFEINHVCWARRAGGSGGGRGQVEDVIVTTGDDGLIKVWGL